MDTLRADVAIIGGGIVGLATAYQLACRPTGVSPSAGNGPRPGLRPCTVVVLEKEPELAAHQTGHNSGVLHSGIYYKPGSLKAVNCREGKLAMEAFCRAEGIPFEICGKVIVAVDESELPALERIHERGQANGVRCELIDRARLAELEPHAAGVRAVHVPEAGIVDFAAVCQRLAARVREAGGTILTRARVTGLRSSQARVVLDSTAGVVEARLAVNCAGLYSDRVTRLGGQRPQARIVPFRGEYYELRPEARHLCRNLIYPVPDASFPFLGVHFTRMIHGGVECGPNAVLAFAREGYRKTDVSLRDLFESLTYPGFLRLAAKHWKTGLGEMWRSLSKRAFVKALQRLLPEIEPQHLVPAPAGVRAQALARDGGLVDDFLIQEHDRIVNVCNAPSPAATASLNIGRLIAETLAPRLT
ncbi:MAG TPA: L-2-hydroxyglutarate oxidase [Planctomycetaceae bacterium]|nr:L-2-hydroxyglutarate oxidase [Planctomycetaceae bacterium]